MPMNKRKIAAAFLAFAMIAVGPAAVAETDGEDVRLTVTADRTAVAKDEPVTLTYELFSRYDTRYEGFKKEARMTGFWIERMEITEKSIQRQVVTVDGKKYVKATVHKVRVFPMDAGKQVIEPGVVQVSIRKKDKDFVTLALDTDPVTVEVRETGAPSKFLKGIPVGGKDSPAATGNPNIILLMDVSGTMLAEDMPPLNRLDATKHVVKEFLDSKPQAAIGVKIFAKEVRTIELLSGRTGADLKGVEAGAISDGTALGDAIFDAMKDLGDKPGVRAIVILTDSSPNNAGHLEPLTAAKHAAELGIGIYAVGVGKSGIVPYPVNDPKKGRQIIMAELQADHETFETMASLTKGLYFKAETEDALRESFAKIRKALSV